MSDWDVAVFHVDDAHELLEELLDLEPEDRLEALSDTCRLALAEDADDLARTHGLVAATIAAIWQGAPYTATDIVEAYPFIREGIGELDEQLRDLAMALFDAAEEDADTWIDLLTSDTDTRELLEEDLAVIGEVVR